MAFGGFLAHDPAHTLDPIKVVNGQSVCGADQCGLPTPNPTCDPIPVPNDDPAFNQECLAFFRSARTSSNEQTNRLTSYLDLTQVYGTSEEQQNGLRSPNSPYLNMTDPTALNLGSGIMTGKDLLPQTDGIKCRKDDPKFKCFIAGDVRVNLFPQLIVFHTVFAREHNRLAAELQNINPCWNADKVFQEAKKINIAQYEHIVYNEYLRTMFDETDYEAYDLQPDQPGSPNYSYDDDQDATIANAFHAGAFRFSHSNIPPKVSLAERDFDIYNETDFSGVIFNPSLSYDPGNPDVTGLDALTFGMLAASSEVTDDAFNPQLTQFFDAPSANVLATDLESTDIERGRDHFLPGYNEWREFCGLQKLDFDDSTEDSNDIPEDIINELQDIYSHEDDIDLFIGGMLETISNTSTLGPTFACLNAKTFHNVKFGDRFWYENEKTGFTTNQLNSIKQITLARILCDNLDDPNTMAPFVFLFPKSEAISGAKGRGSPWEKEDGSYDHIYESKVPGNTNNARVSCSSTTSLPRTDLTKWECCSN